jgi:ArsR family metal-binding transcriptional regulator
LRLEQKDFTLDRWLTTFAGAEQAQKAMRALSERGLPFQTVSPEPGLRAVGADSIVVDAETRAAAMRISPDDFACAGWVEYRPASIAAAQEEPSVFPDDVFGRAAIMVLAPCVADTTKIRLIAHISGDMTEAFPYLNAEMQTACYNQHGPTFTFMDGYRMINLYPRRLTVAKADEIVDAWRTMEDIRRRVNGVWARRDAILPCYRMREKPPALEIFKRLPGVNCGACGQRTCLAFAVHLWQGQGRLSECRPVFEGEHRRLKDALVAICGGLGVQE